jgi:hypothetical protein
MGLKKREREKDISKPSRGRVPAVSRVTTLPLFIHRTVDECTLCVCVTLS